MTSQKRFFWNCGLLSSVQKNLSKNNTHANIGSLLCKQLRYGFLKFKSLHVKPSYLVLVPSVRNGRLLWNCVKLQTSLSSLSLMIAIWNFAHVLAATVYITWWGLKVWMEKFAKLWHHTSVLYKSILQRFVWKISDGLDGEYDSKTASQQLFLALWHLLTWTNQTARKQEIQSFPQGKLTLCSINRFASFPPWLVAHTHRW